ncbi:RNA polymerase sigma-70 factor [Chitinophaga polysaccharea]|uniref:RNA polymerase sigma-70 factor n=1 Tax=Chitinophaga TaxID=79328 RepID=UPI001455904E|nr:RNA polymerase sigma-70 factor [Chitinophaga sp. Ak27]NLR58662.1 RNA polymerase sigma-70 factor [Chitinophaga polysaccharea]NLU91190.1 RNA polymerase sigma-70 factor [Chitinophaga sp. Ak27]
MNIPDDRKLFSAIAHGDEAAFRLLYHRYNALLIGSVKKLLKSDTTAEEVMQEVFLKVWLLRDTLADIENPGGWLYTLASNRSLSVLRQHAREKNRQDDIIADIPDQDDFSAGIYAKELQGLIKTAVEKLPASRREVFMMNTQEGKSRREIAEALDISENTVKNQLVTARKFIREYLEKHTGTRLPILLITLLSRFL